ARKKMRDVGVPVVPGTVEPVRTPEQAIQAIKTIGYPVLIKAAAGGGGRGMRIVRAESELAGAFEAAKSEAEKAFGDGRLYLERLLEGPRHIEIQILADQHGRTTSLGERECSIQRRHQKLVEEAPSVVVTQELRDRIGGILVKSLGEIGYRNAGTVEFLMDEDGALYFIEMNTRIQVEHPVTEMTTDVDLVKSQIRIAAGEKLNDIILHKVQFRGHAIECRINAEHPEKFTPSAGKITALNLPGGTGIRVDTAAYAEGVIPPYYDSLIAKLIARGRDREEAVSRMARALDMFVVEGIYTTIPLHKKIMADPEFRAGQIDTKFMERFFARSAEAAT
ncbi:MAG: ATP-grasp domain-containing protein, partial [Acetobacteraceae bacterium]|nr:ATP-grasp domain-containing protein [Acetobacteraceae bacterium]